MPVLDGIGVAGAICSLIPRCNTNRDNMEREFDRWHEQAKAKGLDKALESLTDEVKKELFGDADSVDDEDGLPDNANPARKWGEGWIKEVDAHIKELEKELPGGGPPDPNNPKHDNVKHHKGELKGFIQNLEKELKRMPNNKSKQQPLKDAIQRAKDAIERWGGDQ